MKPARMPFLLVAVLVVVASACSQSAGEAPDTSVDAGGASEAGEGAEDPLEALYKAALEEGQVEYWSATDPEIVNGYIAAFEETYPGIDVNYFQIRPGDSVPRTLAEASAGQVNYDIGEGRISAIAPLLVRDLVAHHTDWQDVFGDAIPDEAILHDGRLLVRTSLAYPILYNTSRLSPEELPESWEDLLDETWRGRILIEERGNAFGYLALEWGVEDTIAYAEALSQMDPVYVRGGYTVMEQLLGGVADIAIGGYLYDVYDKASEGLPVDWVRVSPMGSGTTTMYLLKESPNPNAAKLFAGWLTSQEGQEAILAHSFDVPLLYGENQLINDVRESGITVLHESMENYLIVEENQPDITAALTGQ